jgi:hypothetical protein
MAMLHTLVPLMRRLIAALLGIVVSADAVGALDFIALMAPVVVIEESDEATGERCTSGSEQETRSRDDVLSKNAAHRTIAVKDFDFVTTAGSLPVHTHHESAAPFPGAQLLLSAQLVRSLYLLNCCLRQ